MKHFEISHLGPIDHASVDFGDLTILVGPQASGKSLFLETLKLVVDRDHIVHTLDRYNYIIGHRTDKILNVYYGDGMSGLWTDDTVLSLDGTTYPKSWLPKKPQNGPAEQLFYIPAQRIFGISDGRPKNFMEFDNTSPYVLRAFSETLRLFMQHGMGSADVLFPVKNRLKGFMKNSFDESIFHSGRVVMEERAGQRKMLLRVDNLSIPFMAWSAGQKEFMPLLLGFYCLSGPPSKVVKKERYQIVVVEEPEMGLHPKAIISVILQLLELIQSGYRVIVSTHSSVFLEFAWAFRNLQANEAGRDKALLELFRIKQSDSPMARMLSGVFGKTIRTYFFRQMHGPHGKVKSADISSLDVFDKREFVSTWGDLSGFASRTSDVVSRYVVDEDE